MVFREGCGLITELLAALPRSALAARIGDVFDYSKIEAARAFLVFLSGVTAESKEIEDPTDSLTFLATLLTICWVGSSE